ncbi:ankyrin repeat-containing domain protein [Ilyonectria robusta]|uniref:ankyrin repeat-containing domain protein n=1 Tax=Ilyonectria robusta TaxID=1079257 RepID=UPI001E8CA584|nr:ankyrin repeat-containing domain protein [Ilyonectria robusta]KAH8714742.1 ankyrin repeat-containing domain protein [Ilyonectria robusta]
MSLLHRDVESDSDGFNTGEFDDNTVLIRRADVSDFNPGNILPEPAAVLGDITSWLKPTEYDDDGSEYQKHISFRLPGTGDWVYSTDEYRQWHDGPDPGIFWVRGTPGSGKSVLAASLIKKLSQEECPVLYFFFRHTIAANNNPSAAVRDWLAQVLKFSPPLQVELKKCVREGQGEEVSVEKLSIAELFHLLRTALSHLPKAYILVDALDEMDQDALESFLQHFYELVKWHPLELKLFMTSRPVAVVEKIVRSVKVLDVRLHKQRVEPDIVAYVQHRLADSSIPADSLSRIAKTIMDRCDGLFLYARLAIDHVLERPDQDLDNSLRAIPAGLSIVYSNILEEQSDRTDIPVGLQQFVLELVTHATRPLRLLEISDLANVTRDMGNLGTTKNLIRSVCGPLLEILPDETVHVVHHSLTEFLNGTTRNTGQSTYPVFEPGPTHNRLALLCISYLRAGCLDSYNIQPNDFFHRGLQNRFDQVLPPFTRYAALNWHVHFRKAIRAGHDQSEVNKQAHAMLVNENLEKLGILAGASETCGFTPLGLATFFKLTSLAREVLDHEKANSEANQSIKEPPFRHAAATGDVELVKLLLEYGADPRAYDESGESTLHFAVRYNQHQVVKALLDASVDPLIPRGEDKRLMENVIGEGLTDSPTGSPVDYAVREGDLQMVSIFTPHLKTAEVANWALERAVINQRREILGHLLEHPMVHVNSKLRFCTPLYTACAYRDADSINLLLKAGADPNIVHNIDSWTERSDDEIAKTGYNVLHALAGFGEPMPLNPIKRSNDTETRRCFRLVLDAGAKLDLVDIKGCTPLHIASDAIAVECLLDAGIDPNVTNRAGETLLHTTRSEDILRILAPRVDINAKSQLSGATPLLGTLKERYINSDFKIKKASLLLELGANAAAVDDEGNGTLHHIAATNRLGQPGLLLLQQLHANGADASLRNNEGKTPLHWCVPGTGSGKYGMREGTMVLDELIACGADLEIKDNEGQTALFQMMSSNDGYGAEGKIKLCEQMVAGGARIDTMDLEGRNLLHCAMESSWSGASLVRFLVSQGIDPHQTDSRGNTLWHLAAPRFAKAPPDSAMISELRGLGVNPVRKNHDGQTPLHIVARFHPSAFRSSNSFSSNGRPTNADDACFFDTFVSLYKNVDCVDNDGVTPLHVASTFSEYLTRRLLEEGADPRKKTLEGLTPLHLAARSRQTNTLGILLAWLKAEVDEATALELLNACDRMNRSALYYGCASGRVETAQMLLDAGVVVDTDSYVGSPWDGCIALQDEEAAKWRRSSAGIDHLDSEPDGAGVFIPDTMRTKLDLEGTGFHRRFPFTHERLDEIIDLLVTNGSASGARYIDQAISSAVEKQFDHATECLLRARERLGSKEGYKLDDETSARLSQRNDAPLPSDLPYGESLVIVLMGRRQYSLATREILQHVESMLGEDKLHKDYSMHHGTILHCLVAGGFASILDQVARPEAIQAIRAREDSGPIPLLVEACQREWWNMDVVRLLVETKGADPSATALALRKSGYGYGLKARGPTALHILIRGGRWWQTNEALPYLLRKGADVEGRDERGITPLGAALEAINGPHFNRKTVEMLLQFGADPNAVDNRGQTCLSRVGGNMDIYQLLIRHGATISPSTMVSAINRQDVTLLEALLASGVDPNLRKPGKEVPAWVSPDGRTLRPHRSDPGEPLEQYPIELLTAKEGDDKRDKRVSEKMLKLLLDHGANPSARYETTTVMHRLIHQGPMIRAYLDGKSQLLKILLQNPNLDMEAREDDSGMTLLLSACSRGRIFVPPTQSEKPTLIQLLLEAGANVRARDNKGRTALHILLAADSYLRTHKNPDVSRIIAAAPELVHVADNEGRTPLHAAFHQNIDTRHVYELIEAGANVQASVKSTGDTLLHLLFQQTWVIGLDGEVKVGRKIYYDPEPVCDAAVIKHEKQDNLFRGLLAMDVDVNAQNNQGETPIFTFLRDAEVFARVTDNNEIRRDSAQPIAHDRFRKELYRKQAAVEREYLIWQLFDDVGLDWTVTNCKGETLLHVVAASKMDPNTRVKRFEFLVGKGLDPMQENRDHHTPLDVAAALECDDILALFRT